MRTPSTGTIYQASSRTAIANSNRTILDSSGSSKKGVVKPGDLPFNTTATASPNSRILALGGEGAATRPGVNRTRSSTSVTSNGSATRRTEEDSESESGSGSDEESEESEESEEETPAPPPKVKRTPSGSSQTERSSSGGIIAATTGAVTGAAAAAASAVLPGAKRTESPTNDDDSVEEYGSMESEESEESSEEEDDYAPPRRTAGARSARAEKARAASMPDGVEDDRSGKRDRRKMSRAATIAQETMEKDMKTRNKKGKPLETLKPEDVALTDEDIAEVSDQQQDTSHTRLIFLSTSPGYCCCLESNASVHVESND